jgi:hypothetical protein
MSTPTIGLRSEIGYEVRLRRRGIGRYFGATFLALWLCGWVVGEVFALGVLAWGGVALVTGDPPGPNQEALELATAAATGVFLLVWLGFWTLGGIAAATELLRELWGEDRLVATSDGLLVEWRAGPFGRRRTIPRAEIVDLALLPRYHWLVVDTPRERIEACRLGSETERRAAAAELRRELGLGAAPRPLSPALADEWAEVSTPEGRSALAPSPATRKLQTRVAALVALLAWSVTAAFLHGAASDTAWLPAALLGVAVSAALGFGVVWLARGRNEWRIEAGSLVLQRRFGNRVTERFRAARLALTWHEDSDGDDWYELEARSADAAPEPALFAPFGRAQRRRIVRRMNDDATPRRLGLWLAERTGIPLDDRTGVEAGEAARR